MTSQNMIGYKLDRYFLRVERVAFEYNLLVPDVFDLVEYQDSKRIKRGEGKNLEKSLEVLERTLRIKRR